MRSAGSGAGQTGLGRASLGDRVEQAHVPAVGVAHRGQAHRVVAVGERSRVAASRLVSASGSSSAIFDTVLPMPNGQLRAVALAV